MAIQARSRSTESGTRYTQLAENTKFCLCAVRYAKRNSCRPWNYSNAQQTSKEQEYPSSLCRRQITASTFCPTQLKSVLLCPSFPPHIRRSSFIFFLSIFLLAPHVCARHVLSLRLSRNCFFKPASCTGDGRRQGSCVCMLPIHKSPSAAVLNERGVHVCMYV